MIWVLFLIFRETGHEALAKFDTADKCKVKMAELREAYREEQNPGLIPGFLVMNAFQCLIKYEGRERPHPLSVTLGQGA